MAALKFLFVTVLAINYVSCDVLTDTEVIDAAQAEINTEQAIEYEKERPDRDAPVSYQGAQLWRVPFNDHSRKSAVSELQKKYNAAMWNLQVANQSNPYVDVFVKRAAVIDARNFMKTVRVPFNVLIEDVQRAIDTENPPLDDIDLWVNRDGKWTGFFGEKLLYIFSSAYLLLTREFVHSHLQPSREKGMHGKLPEITRRVSMRIFRVKYFFGRGGEMIL